MCVHRLSTGDDLGVRIDDISGGRAERKGRYAILGGPAPPPLPSHGRGGRLAQVRGRRRAVGKTPRVTAVGYTNSVAAAKETALTTSTPRTPCSCARRRRTTASWSRWGPLGVKPPPWPASLAASST